MPLNYLVHKTAFASQQSNKSAQKQSCLKHSSRRFRQGHGEKSPFGTPGSDNPGLCSEAAATAGTNGPAPAGRVWAGRLASSLPLLCPLLGWPLPCHAPSFVWSTIALPDGMAWPAAPSSQSLILSGPSRGCGQDTRHSGTGPSHASLAPALTASWSLALRRRRPRAQLDHQEDLRQVYRRQGSRQNHGVIKWSLYLQDTGTKWGGRQSRQGDATRHTPPVLAEGWQCFPAGRHKSSPPVGCPGLHVPAAPACFSKGKGSCERPTREQVGSATPGDTPDWAGRVPPSL